MTTTPKNTVNQDSDHLDSQVASRSTELEPLLKLGLEMIPLRGKVPVGQWRDCVGLTPEDARSRMESGENVGIRLSGRLAVFDYDRRRDLGGDQLDALKDEIRRVCHVDPGDLLTTATGGGGEHLYFLLPESVEPSSLRKTVESLPAVELLRKGHQVVAPGSIHPDTGKMYELLDPEQIAVLQMVDVRQLFNGGYVRSIPAMPMPASNGDEPDFPRFVVEQFIKATNPDLLDDYDAWLRFGMALHHESCGDDWGLDAWMDKSWQDNQTLELCRTKWTSFGGNCDGKLVGGGELIKAARKSGLELHTVKPCHETAVNDFCEVEEEDAKWLEEHGGTVARADLSLDAIPPKYDRDGNLKNSYQTAVSVLNELQPTLGLAFNELRGRAVFRGRRLPWGPTSSYDITDDTIRLLRMYVIERYSVELSKDNAAEAAAAIAYVNRWNPIADYLHALKWDGKRRIDEMLTRYFSAGESDYTVAVSRLLMVAAVRRALKPGCKYDAMVVLEGKQGIGKSTGLKALVPDESWFTDAGLHLGPYTDAGKAMISLEGAWIVEMAELETLNRSETGYIKAWLSRAEDAFRRPYDRYRSESKRRIVVVGTTNETGYLVDTTGNRRFLPVPLSDEIDVACIRRDRDQLWAEAVQMESTYGELTLPRELWDAAGARQAERVTEHPWLQTLKDAVDGIIPMYDRLAPNGILKRVDKVHSSTLLMTLNVQPGRAAQSDSKVLRQQMESIGWRYCRSVRVDGHPGAGYVRIESEQGPIQEGLNL